MHSGEVKLLVQQKMVYELEVRCAQTCKPNSIVQRYTLAQPYKKAKGQSGPSTRGLQNDLGALELNCTCTGFSA